MVRVYFRVIVWVRVRVCVRGRTLKGQSLFIPIKRPRKESRIVLFRHYLPVPGMGKLRACCFSWMW